LFILEIQSSAALWLAASVFRRQPTEPHTSNHHQVSQTTLCAFGNIKKACTLVSKRLTLLTLRLSDVLEILHHLPRSVFEANGFSLVVKLRDIGAAYLDELKVGTSGIVVDEVAKHKVEHLLKQLEALDFRPGGGFLFDTSEY
jgi:hypothetical protein